MVAKKLAATLPTVDEALSAGRIGFDHARGVRRCRQRPQPRQRSSRCSRTSSPPRRAPCSHRWRDDVTALAAYLDPDGSHDPDNDHAATGSPCHRPTRSWRSAASSPANGRSACTTRSTPSRTSCSTSTPATTSSSPSCGVPNRATLLALALEEVCRRALAVDRASTQAPQGRSDPHHPRRPPTPAAATWRRRSRAPGPQALVVDREPAGPATPRRHAPHVPVRPGCSTPRSSTPSASPSTWAEPHAAPPPPNAERSPSVTEDACSPAATPPPRGADAHHIDEWRARRADPRTSNNLCCSVDDTTASHTATGGTLQLDDTGWTRWTTPTGHDPMGPTPPPPTRRTLIQRDPPGHEPVPHPVVRPAGTAPAHRPAVAPGGLPGCAVCSMPDGPQG